MPRSTQIIHLLAVVRRCCRVEHKQPYCERRANVIRVYALSISKETLTKGTTYPIIAWPLGYISGGNHGASLWLCPDWSGRDGAGLASRLMMGVFFSAARGSRLHALRRQQTSQQSFTGCCSRDAKKQMLRMAPPHKIARLSLFGPLPADLEVNLFAAGFCWFSTIFRYPLGSVSVYLTPDSAILVGWSPQ